MSLVQWFKWLIIPNGVSLNASTASLGNWATYQLIPTITPAWVTNNKIHWTSSDTSKATVDSNWLVTGTGDWSVTITATTDYGGYTASCTFTVYTIHVTWISLNESSVNLAPWKTLQLVATIAPENATNKNVTRRSSDASIATVDSNWLVTCLDGSWWETNIIVTTVDGSYTATCTVKQWWWPWEHTVAYFPLIDDFVDQITWEWPTTTTWDIPFTTSDWVICASCPSWSVERSFNNRNFSTWNDPLTWSFWCKKNSYSHEWQVMITTWYWATTRCKAMWFHNNQFWTWWRNNDTYHADAKIWEWALYTWTFDWETTKAYINWELVNSKAMTYSVDTNNYSAIFSQVVQNSSWQAQSADWYYREVIMEDVVWTAEEILEYYNLSKQKFYWTIDDYDELEYIESSWTQYIDTWVTFNTNDKLNNMEMYMKATHSWTWNFMWLYNWSFVTMEVASNANTLRCFIWNSSTYTDRSVLHSDNTTIDEITYNYTSSLATFIVNWTEYTQSRSNWYNTWNTHLTIFARNNNGSMEQYLTMKMYSCYVKIWWEKVRDFMPARRKSDWVVWLRDKIEWKFYQNKWSGSFTAGPKLWVSLDTNSISLTEALQTYQLTATPNPSSVWAQWYQWRSSDTSIATVSSTWLVTCVTPGECTITVTAVATWDTDTCSVIQAIEASYDFRTLSWSELSALWRWQWSQNSLSSNWLMNNNSGNDKYDAVLYCPIDISQANHLYLKWTWYWISWSWAGWSTLWMNSIMSRDSWYRFQTWVWMNNNNWYRWQSIYLEWWDLVNQQIGLSTWDYTVEFDIDFTTWAVSATRTWPTTFTQTATLNATQITNVKTNTKYILSQVWHWYYQGHRIYTMEYSIT